MSPLIWKVYSPTSEDGKMEFAASTRYAIDAAILLASQPNGAVVKCNGAIVYRLGVDEHPHLSYDTAAEIMNARRITRLLDKYKKLYGVEVDRHTDVVQNGHMRVAAAIAMGHDKMPVEYKEAVHA